jgi:hypothetical protein
MSRLLGWMSAGCIGASVLVMITLSAAGPSSAVVYLSGGPPGPPWWLALHLQAGLVTALIWSAVVVGGCGVAAGLAAVARGARPPIQLLAGLALAVVAILTVLPAAGSTDTLDYAAYGRIVVTGHNPYVMTPNQLRRADDEIGEAAPHTWRHARSVYGPLATAEQVAAAELGGTSAGRIIFWLKLWNSLAFLVVALALDRLLRRDPARRARAHLLWTFNPLLLWGLVAGGHVDTIAVGIGVLGVAALPRWQPPEGPNVRRALLAGVLTGAAADLKINLALFWLGVAWAIRRHPAALIASAAGGLAVLVPSYLWSGLAAVKVLVTHKASTQDDLYRLIAAIGGERTLPHLAIIALLVFGLLAALLLRRLPDGFPLRPAVRPALALSLAWLLAWPYQRPWYDAMAFCLLALFPATWIDPLLLVRLVVTTVNTTPGIPGHTPPVPEAVNHWLLVLVIPLLRLGALVAVVVLCLTMVWGPGQAGRHPAEGALGPARGPRKRPLAE